MFHEPAALIQESIDQLEKLSAFLADDVRTAPGGIAPLPPAKLLSKEALLTISVLLPKLRAARHLRAPVHRPGRYCSSCED